MTKHGTAHGKPSIALIGLRGCGKSSVGRELADVLGGDCTDTDGLVVQRAGKSIAAIFEEEGEVGFRRREREIIEQVAADPPAVISVGGGAVLDEDNVRALRQVATLVWLTAPANVLHQRIASDYATGDLRPPLTEWTGPEEIERLLADRSTLYERAADLVIDTMEDTPRNIAQNIAGMVNPKSSE